MACRAAGAARIERGGGAGSHGGAQAPRGPPGGQDFSLFINTLKFNLSGTILAFDGTAADGIRVMALGDGPRFEFQGGGMLRQGVAVGAQGAFLTWRQPEPLR